MGSTATLYRKINIKNWSHGIIHTFKNYFAIMFSVSAKISSIQMNPTSNKNIYKEFERFRREKPFPSCLFQKINLCNTL